MVLYQKKKHNHKQHYKFDKDIEKKIVYTSHHQIQDLMVWDSSHGNYAY